MDIQERETFDGARALLSWYDNGVRAFLSEHASEQVPGLDDERLRLQHWLTRSDETVVCLLGMSGIGKSTLLNAIVAEDRTIAPSGGVGPLTALATEVRYSEEPRVRVEYHSRKHLWRVASALHFHVERERKIAPVKRDTDPLLEESEMRELQEVALGAAEGDNEAARTRMQEHLRAARLIVTGNQNEERDAAYLADALSIACSVQSRWNSSISPEDSGRLDTVKAALHRADKGEIYERSESGDKRAFREFVRDHAAGFLSPLIARIEIGWPSESLRRGLVLVDLPGVGVAGDLYKRETQKYVRERARAVIVVVDRAGATDPMMDMLRTTGYWDRLLLSSDDPQSDPCSLMLVVTRVDDLANEEWFQIEPDEEGRRSPTKVQVFGDVRDRLVASIRQQFEQQISAFVTTDGSDDIRAARELAKKQLLSTLQVHPLSAPEYRRLVSENEDDRPFLKSRNQTGLPTLTESLDALVERNRHARYQRISTLSRRIFDALNAQLAIIEASWTSNRATAEGERVRGQLGVFLTESNKVFETRRLSFRFYLEQTVPEKIKVGVHEAKDEAKKDITRYLRGLREAHWSTLRAAVRRGGTFYGARYINLPSDIAVRFQDPVAAVWSQSLLKGIRQETYKLASDVRGMVEGVCEWAEVNAAAHVDQRVVNSQRKLVSGQVERLRDVGKEAIDELKEAVMAKIVAAIEKPILNECNKFVQQGSDIGKGVRRRILELFEDLANSASDAASKPTEKTLLAHYAEVNKDINKAFQDWGNPIHAAADAIVERHQDREKRSNAQRVKKILEDLARLKAEAPQGAPSSTSESER